MRVFGGPATVSCPAPRAVICSSTSRWSMLKPWVTAAARISTTVDTLAASGVLSANVPPYGSTPGTSEIVGRVPMNRYGGENSSTRCSGYLYGGSL